VGCLVGEDHLKVVQRVALPLTVEAFSGFPTFSLSPKQREEEEGE
jgi:hypothetical protein